MKILDHLEEWIVTFLMGAATLIIFVAALLFLRATRVKLNEESN